MDSHTALVLYTMAWHLFGLVTGVGISAFVGTLLVKATNRRAP